MSLINQFKINNNREKVKLVPFLKKLKKKLKAV